MIGLFVSFAYFTIKLEVRPSAKRVLLKVTPEVKSNAHACSRAKFNRLWSKSYVCKNKAQIMCKCAKRDL